MRPARNGPPADYRARAGRANRRTPPYGSMTCVAGPPGATGSGARLCGNSPQRVTAGAGSGAISRSKKAPYSSACR